VSRPAACRRGEWSESPRRVGDLAYALCGFAHLPSTGDFCGGLSALAPGAEGVVGEPSPGAVLAGSTLPACSPGPWPACWADSPGFSPGHVSGLCKQQEPESYRQFKPSGMSPPQTGQRSLLGLRLGWAGSVQAGGPDGMATRGPSNAPPVITERIQLDVCWSSCVIVLGHSGITTSRCKVFPYNIR